MGGAYETASFGLSTKHMDIALSQEYLDKTQILYKEDIFLEKVKIKKRLILF